MGAALALQRIQRERGLQIIVKNKAEVGTLGPLYRTFLLLPGCLIKSWKGGCVWGGGGNGGGHCGGFVHGMYFASHRLGTSCARCSDRLLALLLHSTHTTTPTTPTTPVFQYADSAAVLAQFAGPTFRVAGARLSNIVKATGGYKEGADWVE